jgi:pyruvate oxidase
VNAADGATWVRVAAPGELPEGRVKTVTAGRRSLVLTHHAGRYGALDNRCPHQGGPLGEGSIERGWLRCPWHGYDYDPLDGRPPPGFSDAPACFATEVRPDGIYVAVPPEPERGRTVSDVMVETMVNWGVTHVFGMVGHSNLGFADAMRVASERGDLTYIGVRHEGAAAFAASAFGKLTGRPGACFGIAGPGSTNLLTGLYDAKVDRAPVLAVSGQVPSKVKGRGAFQDLDLEAAFGDVAGWSETVQAGSDHAELMSLACKHAIDQREVAHLVLPDDVQPLQVDPDRRAATPAGRTGADDIAPPAVAVTAASELVAGSARPMVIVGYGARDHMADVIALAQHIGAPVATTFKAKGQISDHHPLGCGVMGRSGTPIASWFMNEADVLVVFGASFANHTGIAPYKPIVQVDSDPAALGRFHPVAVPVLGDAGVTARALRDGLGDRPWVCLDHRPEVAERWAIWRAEKASRRADDLGRGLGAAAVFDALTRLAPDDAVIAVDVGNNTYSFGRYFEVTAQTVLMSGYLGSIGFGFPAAMGAWAGVQATGSARRVIAVAGDGGFGQYAMELTTAVKYGMDITLLLLNNGQLGKISKEQRAIEYDVWQTELVNPDFAAYAELCGATGIRVADPSGLDDAIGRALATDGPALVEVMQDPLLV